ncbi:response regulator [Pannus brasiliensis CCIBt3594]|uniref:Response regulator n=1 Tax=Pannus brasiliensis CCIBt3594 TaxID=1427578 RepID=A0AAW9QPD6_9CHRO
MPYRILLVDDSPEDREVSRRFLSKGSPDKYRIVEAGSIEDGLRAYREEAIDLILLDYRLPDGTGLDFIEESEGEIDCPIVVLTGQGNEKIAVEMMKAGAADYLVKGDLSADLLRHAVRAAIEKHSLRKKIEREREEQRVITNLALRLQKSLNLSEILATATTEIRASLGADRVLIYRFHPGSGGSIVAATTAKPWPECPPISIGDSYLRGDKAGEDLAGEVRAIADVGSMNYPRCYLELLRRFEVRSHAIAPIPLGPIGNESERLWGLLIVHQCSGPRRWRSSEIEGLRQLSLQLGGAIERAELYERLERSLALRTRELGETREKLHVILNGTGENLSYPGAIADLL